jgi:acyl-CoA synthetase (NDP forming)
LLYWDILIFTRKSGDISREMNSIIEQVTGEGRLVLTEIESKRLLTQAGINCIETELALSEAEAISVSRKMGFPIALKIASPDIIHKNDGGGVRLGLATPEEVRTAYRDILKNTRQYNPEAKIDGVTVQKMALPGVAVIIGSFKDSQFGPVIIFGLGGLLVEIIEDIALKVAPITPKDAIDMIQEIKGYKLLTGYRGQPPVNISALEEMLLVVSNFVENNPVVKEIDLNPVIAGVDSSVAVDARVVLEENALGKR